MDNASRSERTRNAVIQAALTIIARDGAGKLTMDAIARESGISKGGVMHQFRTKQAVVKALLERQVESLDAFSRNYLASYDPSKTQATLSSEIAIQREVLAKPTSAVFAILGAIAEEPGFLAMFRELDAKRLEIIKADAPDPDLATLRWLAARGMVFTAILGLCPLSDEERQRLFERLLDHSRWPSGN
ncbi:TetR/AcrR family transcriptional regulator [Bosea sp. LjRoot9]|uniref:TetR/AcrR family transcriptional regulator n=1 Tax=Bosea sp. LjRoot9 TaxID=3342341 RepID=UPI003ECFBF14